MMSDDLTRLKSVVRPLERIFFFFLKVYYHHIPKLTRRIYNHQFTRSQKSIIFKKINDMQQHIRKNLIKYLTLY